MRIIRFLIYYAMVTALGVMALLFLALNHFTVQLDLIEAQYSVSVAWVIVGAAAFGFLIAFLLLLPGRIAAALYARALARDVRALNDDVRDLEYALDEQEDLRGRLVEQHEVLLERHERILLRHQSLVSDHSQAVAERNDARAQLDALRIARPAASVSHGSAAALRLLPQAQPPSPAPAPAAIPSALPPPAPTPAAQPVPMPVPVPLPAPVAIARIATPDSPQSAAPAEARPVTPITPGPWPGVVATPEPASEPGAPEPAPEPATVPVVSAPATVTPPASVPAASAPVAPRPKGPSIWTRLQTNARQSWQATATRFTQTRRQVQQRSGRAWRAFSTTVSAQSRAQAARLQALQQRLTAARHEAE